ncbi:hypothetical protein BRD03_02205 [Halobacteriales archaeon QS_9_68_17]|nr:MAG: hypothetical protein BRD03_02205 [Halobacteriales archaeon QS_9_68_17]
MHVCFVFHHHYPADFSTALLEYSRELAELGHEVTVIAGREETNTLKRETIDGVSVHRILTDLSTSVSIEPTLFGYKAMRKAEQIHSESPIDIFHLRSFPNLGLILDRFPWMDLPEATVSDVRGTAVSNSVFEWVSRIGIRIQDLFVDETLVIDKHVARRIFVDASSVTILPLGVDFDKFVPGQNVELRKRWGLDDRCVVGYTGHLHPSRELERFIRAFDQANEERPELALAVVGGGEARPALERHVADVGVEDDVVFTGSVPFEEMPSYLQAFDVGCAYIPDKPQYRNQPPLKTVEYLAATLPVLATDTPGNRRFATTENSLLVSDRIPEYRDGLLRLSNDETLRRTLSKRARESVSDFNYATITENKLLQAYQNIVSN